MEGLLTLAVMLVALVIFSLLFGANINDSKAMKNFTEVTAPLCKFSYNQNENDTLLERCFEPIRQVQNIFSSNVPILGNKNVTLDYSITPTINMQELNTSRIWKSKVSFPSVSSVKFDNVGEPSFASNGSLVFYAGNHYAARSKIGGSWEHVNPNFDFKGMEVLNQTMPGNSSLMTGKKIPIFKADQHIEYDPHHEMYLWIRQGDRVSYSGGFANIDRLSVSKDTVNWTVHDLISTRVLTSADIFNALFDYPDTVITANYLYLTTTVYNTDENNKYGLILRFSLDHLRNSLDNLSASFSYDIILDKNVESITPVQGASNPMYFGAHLPNDSSIMKIYAWNENSTIPDSIEIPIIPWNGIDNHKICNLNSEVWWCKANTSSRIRSAWMFNDSINFLWNALVSYDKGTTWLPYIDSATFYLGKKMQYERKYHLADEHTAWMFGAAAPSENENLGVSAFYYKIDNPESHIHPYVNLAFGVFNTASGKWDMMPVVNSSSPLPVKNEEGNDDYNIGDFLTTRPHEGRDNKYLWDTSGYVIVGGNYSNTDPYFIMIR
jgi:hypothetical protein